MDPYERLSVLIELAESLQIPVRRVPAPGESQEHPGGAVVRVKDRTVLFLYTTAGVSDQIAVVASALHSRKELQDRFLPPEIREILDACPPEG